MLDDGAACVEPSARKLTAEGRAAWGRGDTELALRLYDDALAELELRPSDVILAEALRGKGTVLRETGQTEAAHSNYMRSLEASNRAGLPGARAHAHNCLAIVAQRRGDLRETERHYREAVELATVAEDHRLLGMIEQNRGVLASIRGDLGRAANLYEKSLAAFELAGDREAMSWVLNNLGMIRTRSGDYRAAQSALERGLAMARSRGDEVVSSVILLNLAELWLAAGRLRKAKTTCARAIDCARRRGDRLTVAEGLTCRAKIERHLGALDSGIATLRMAQYESDDTEDKLLRGEILRELGELQRVRGNAKEARRAWLDAAKTFRTAGAEADAADMDKRMNEMARYD